MMEGAPRRLANYIRLLPGFEIQAQIDGNYGHVGAALADAVPQSNNNYERNVRRRVARIRNDYKTCVILTDNLKILVGQNRSRGSSPPQLPCRSRFGQCARLYSLAQDIIHGAADLMSISHSYLDHSIWRYMSTRGAQPVSQRRPSDCRDIQGKP
jgi:hypothetical protein